MSLPRVRRATTSLSYRRQGDDLELEVDTPASSEPGWMPIVRTIGLMEWQVGGKSLTLTV
jgi:hypothetical protein